MQSLLQAVTKRHSEPHRTPVFLWHPHPRAALQALAKGFSPARLSELHNIPSPSREAVLSLQPRALLSTLKMKAWSAQKKENSTKYTWRFERFIFHPLQRQQMHHS